MDLVELPISKEGLAKLKLGMTCGFEKDGQINRYKIKRINRKKVKCWAEPVFLYTPKEFADIMHNKKRPHSVEEGR